MLRLVSEAAVRFEPSVRIAECRDAKDNIYLELALTAGVRIIVSSDMDLLVLRPWRGVRIVQSSAYLTSQSEP